jgi:hypothetical protein
MQALLLTEVPLATLPLQSDSTSTQGLDIDDLQWLGERMRVAYGAVEVPLPVRLSELVERLARREQSR